MKRKIAFTVDIDWAPDPVIEDTIDLFKNYGIKCTLFATHDSPALKNLDTEMFEIGIHPNFNSLLEGKSGSLNQIVKNLLDLYPEAKGVRSHSMLQSSRVLSCFKENHFIYESNHFLPYWKMIYPFRLWNGLIRIPYNWEDDIHWAYGKSFSDCGLDFNEEGIFVLDFHPIHVFLNTECEERYRTAYHAYHSSDQLLTFRNNGPTLGTRDLLISLLQHFQNSIVKPIKMIDIANSMAGSL